MTTIVLLPRPLVRPAPAASLLRAASSKSVEACSPARRGGHGCDRDLPVRDGHGSEAGEALGAQELPWSDKRDT